jgi:hypothetical protein
MEKKGSEQFGGLPWMTTETTLRKQCFKYLPLSPEIPQLAKTLHIEPSPWLYASMPENKGFFEIRKSDFGLKQILFERDWV